MGKQRSNIERIAKGVTGAALVIAGAGSFVYNQFNDIFGDNELEASMIAGGTAGLGAGLIQDAVTDHCESPDNKKCTRTTKAIIGTTIVIGAAGTWLYHRFVRKFFSDHEIEISTGASAAAGYGLAMIFDAATSKCTDPKQADIKDPNISTKNDARIDPRSLEEGVGVNTYARQTKETYIGNWTIECNIIEDDDTYVGTCYGYTNNRYGRFVVDITSESHERNPDTIIDIYSDPKERQKCFAYDMDGNELTDISYVEIGQHSIIFREINKKTQGYVVDLNAASTAPTAGHVSWPKKPEGFIEPSATLYGSSLGKSNNEVGLVVE